MEPGVRPAGETEVRLESGHAAVQRVLSARNEFEVLGLKPEWPVGATDAWLRSCFRQAALKVHPDKNAAEGAAAAFLRVYQAMESLLDLEERTRILHDFAGEGKRGRTQTHRVPPHPKRQKREPTVEEVEAAFRAEEARFFAEMQSSRAFRNWPTKKRALSPPRVEEFVEMTAEEESSFTGRVASWRSFKSKGRTAQGVTLQERHEWGEEEEEEEDERSHRRRMDDQGWASAGVVTHISSPAMSCSSVPAGLEKVPDLQGGMSRCAFAESFGQAAAGLSPVPLRQVPPAPPMPELDPDKLEE